MAVTAVIVSGCSHPVGSTSTSGPTSSTSPAGHETEPAHPKTTPTKPPESPLASPTVEPVVRNGVRPHPSISAAPAPFGHPVVYPDGVRLAVTGIHQGQVTGQGPGVVAGAEDDVRPRFTNGSTKPVSAGPGRATASFGSPARIASPVYDARTQDFGATVAPGHKATATYAFSIPVDQLSDVTIHLDFDGRHYAATFHGSVSH